MEDFQCDLLEHFYCASCRKGLFISQSESHAKAYRPSIADPSLKTTWRIRCANGQQHPYPDSADACWKAALPPLSKYCSTECGMDAMERRIAPIVCANAGMGQVAEGELLIPRTPAIKTEMSRLWKGVKDARKRDAVVVHANTKATDIRPSTQPVSVIKAPPQRTDAERLAASLKELTVELENLTHDSHLRSRELEFILARGRLARLAVQWSDKGENVNRCCFDARLLLEGVEWEEWVEGVGRAVLEGTADATGAVRIGSNHAAITAKGEGRVISSATGTGDEEELHLEMEAADSPWCDGRRKCERHFGWQKLCLAEFELNKGIKVGGSSYVIWYFY
jgi:COMPASS component SPP1